MRSPALYRSHSSIQQIYQQIYQQICTSFLRASLRDVIYLYMFPQVVQWSTRTKVVRVPGFVLPGTRRRNVLGSSGTVECSVLTHNTPPRTNVERRAMGLWKETSTIFFQNHLFRLCCPLDWEKIGSENNPTGGVLSYY